jgi:hypothetical protein
VGVAKYAKEGLYAREARRIALAAADEATIATSVGRLRRRRSSAMSVIGHRM